MNFKQKLLSPCLGLLIFLIPIAMVEAKPFVLGTLPEITWLLHEIGGDEIEVGSLVRGNEDPHYIEANPQQILLLNRADLVCEIGLQLEAAWLDRAIKRARNPKLKRNCILSDFVSLMGKIETPVDRSMGHLHPDGNPHFWLSLKSMKEASVGVLSALSQLSPEHSEKFESRQKALSKKMAELVDKNRRILKDFTNLEVMEYHEEFSYFLRDYGWTSVWSLEEFPGRSPSAGHLLRQAEKAKSRSVRLILASEYNPQDLLQRFQAMSDVPYLQLSPQMPANADLLQFHEKQVQKLVEKLRQLS